MDLQGTREATHAAPGDRGWYTANPKVLAEQLQKNLDAVPEEIDGQKLPLKGAKVIIAPYVFQSTLSLRVVSVPCQFAVKAQMS